MSGGEESFEERVLHGSRRQRSNSLRSKGDEEQNVDDSVLLLVGRVEGGGEDQDQPAEDPLQSAIIGRAVKRAIEPLLSEMKSLKKQSIQMEKKVNKVLVTNDNLEKVMKEMVSKNQKDTEGLDSLLTVDGLRKLKSWCFKNLDMKAKDKDETALLNKFMEVGKEEGWLLKTSAKAQKDIITNYRAKRNYFKAQTRIRILTDMTNKTEEEASDLPTATKFIRDSLGVIDLDDDHLIILYNFAYTHLKYLNSRVARSTMSELDKKHVKNANEDIWVYVMERVAQDRSKKRSHSVIKDRFISILHSGQRFEPAE